MTGQMGVHLSLPQTHLDPGGSQLWFPFEPPESGTLKTRDGEPPPVESPEPHRVSAMTTPLASGVGTPLTWLCTQAQQRRPVHWRFGGGSLKGFPFGAGFKGGPEGTPPHWFCVFFFFWGGVGVGGGGWGGGGVARKKTTFIRRLKEMSSSIRLVHSFGAMGLLDPLSLFGGVKR